MNSAIVITVDALHAGMLGCYGNSWVSTPAVDRLAAEGFVFDQAFAEAVLADELISAIWQATPTIADRQREARRKSWLTNLNEQGVETTLVTDVDDLSELPSAEAFARNVCVACPNHDKPAEEIAETWLARCFAEALSLIEEAGSPRLLWLHLSSLGHYWDAPLSSREQFADTEDPSPYAGILPPVTTLPEEQGAFDPDERLTFRFAYAGQVTTLDRCLEAFLDAVAAQPSTNDALIILAGLRGFPLGEHRRIGMTAEPELHNELLQMPLIVRMPNGESTALRSQSLVQPADVGATLSEWFGASDDNRHPSAMSLLPILLGERIETRWWAFSHTPRGEVAMRTPAWLLLDDSVGEASSSEHTAARLYAKPDDRWELNDVADRVPEIASSMQRAANDCLAAAQANRLDGLEPADEAILTSLD